MLDEENFINYQGLIENMVKRIWDKFLTDQDRNVFKASGYGNLAGFGEKPAVLIIDVNYNFLGDKPEPILKSIKFL